MTYQDFLEQLLAHMGCTDCTVSIKEDEVIEITIQASEADSGMLIGRKGETLQSIQRILASAFRDQLGEKRISVDINDYKHRRNDVVQDMALEAADRVKETGVSVTLPPLSAEERRLVHMVLRDSGLVTQSQGDGLARRLTIYPQGQES